MSQETNTVAWWRLLNRYQWFVLIVAAAGWLLDCMDQQLFNLARTPAMKELLKGTFAPDATPGQIAASVQEHAGYSTAIFLLGWATGGLIFGVLGDRIGRAKTGMGLFATEVIPHFRGLTRPMRMRHRRSAELVDVIESHVDQFPKPGAALGRRPTDRKPIDEVIRHHLQVLALFLRVVLHVVTRLHVRC